MKAGRGRLDRHQQQMNPRLCPASSVQRPASCVSASAARLDGNWQLATAPRVVLNKRTFWTFVHNCVVSQLDAAETQKLLPAVQQQQLQMSWPWPWLDLIHGQLACMSLLILMMPLIIKVHVTFMARSNPGQGRQPVIKQSHDQRQPLGWPLDIGSWQLALTRLGPSL